MTIREAEATEKEAERQFEIEASTMDRQQIYDLAKRLWVDLAEARGVISEALKHLRFANPRNGPAIKGIGILEAAKKD